MNDRRKEIKDCLPNLIRANFREKISFCIVNYSIIVTREKIDKLSFGESNVVTFDYKLSDCVPIGSSCNNNVSPFSQNTPKFANNKIKAVRWDMLNHRMGKNNIKRTIVEWNVLAIVKLNVQVFEVCASGRCQ